MSEFGLQKSIQYPQFHSCLGDRLLFIQKDRVIRKIHYTKMYCTKSNLIFLGASHIHMSMLKAFCFLISGLVFRKKGLWISESQRHTTFILHRILYYNVNFYHSFCQSLWTLPLNTSHPEWKDNTQSALQQLVHILDCRVQGSFSHISFGEALHPTQYLDLQPPWRCHGCKHDRWGSFCSHWVIFSDIVDNFFHQLTSCIIWIRQHCPI